MHHENNIWLSHMQMEGTKGAKKKNRKSHISNTWVPKMEISLSFIITHYKSLNHARTQPMISHKLMCDF